MPTNRRCELCTYWRTPTAEHSRVCVINGVPTEHDFYCGYFQRSARPFSPNNPPQDAKTPAALNEE